MTGSYGSLSSDSEELLCWSLASAIVQNPNPSWKEFHFPNILTNIYFHLGFWWWLSWFGMEWIFSTVWNYISLMVTSFFFWFTMLNSAIFSCLIRPVWDVLPFFQDKVRPLSFWFFFTTSHSGKFTIFSPGVKINFNGHSIILKWHFTFDLK